MKKVTYKILSIGLSTALCLGGIGATAYAINGDKSSEETTATSVKAATTVADDQDITKDETVYILANADGSVKKVIVSDWLQNKKGLDTLTDLTGLTDIQNTKGSETFSQTDGNKTVWNAGGNDIYYQGSTDAELPVTLKISYTLDGKAISPDELVGKSGKVTIRFDYENTQSRTVEVNGEKETMYVPYAMLTATILDGDVFRNVEVKNGRLVNDGNRDVVIGMAFPGMQKNLNIDTDKVEIPEYVEITADVTDFEMGMTITAATNTIFNQLDTSKLDSVEDLDSAVDQIKEAMDALMDGSSQLSDGLATLLEKSQELVKGVDQIADGTSQVLNGAGSLNDGAAALKAGTSELSSGLSKLAANNSTLQGGAKQVFDTLLSTANTQLAAAGLTVPALTTDNYAAVLTGVINSLDKDQVYASALSQVTAGVEAKRPEITAAVTAAVRENVKTQVTASVSEQVKQQMLAQGVPAESVDAYVEAKLQESDMQALIESNTDAQMQTEQVQGMIAQTVEQKVQEAIAATMATPEIQQKLAAAESGAQTIMNLKTSLDSYNAFYQGLNTYTSGVATAAAGAAKLDAGASTLQSGTSQLKQGAATLNDGAAKLKAGAPALIDGVTQLKDGSVKLTEGLDRFYDEGICKIIDLIDGDLEGFLNRLKATVDLSKEYQNYSGIDSDMAGEVKFIYRTDEIKK